MIRKFFDSGFKVLGAVDSAELFPLQDTVETEVETPAEPEKPAEVKAEIKPEAEVAPPPVETEVEEPVKERPVAETTQKAELDWKEVLKKVDRKELLKEAGLDDFEIGLLDYRKSTGDLTPYLEVKTKDWDKMNEVAVLRDDLRRKYPDLSDEDFDLLADKRINQKYLLTESELVDEKEVKLAKIELKSEADSIRKKRKEEQQNFKAPELKADDTQAKQQEAQEKAYAEYVEGVKKNPATQKLLAEQKLVMGEGNETYNYKVNSAELVEIAENPNKFFGLFGEAGKEKWEDFYATVAYAKNRKQIEKALIDYGKSLAIKESAEELENTSKEEPPKAAPKKETLGQALATRAVPYSMT